MTAPDDDTTAALMNTALSLAQQIPDMMAESIACLEQQLIPIYERAHETGDIALMGAIDSLWTMVQHIHRMATSQALGVASAGIMTIGYKLQRDEAYLELERVTAASQELLALMGGGV